MKKFCIPYAGGTVEIFNNFKSVVDECVCIEYAGHGTRRKEAYYSTFQEMVDDVASCINSQSDVGEAIVLFGYSMGSIVTYELLAQELLLGDVKYVMFASHESPETKWDSMEFKDKSEVEFFRVIQDMGGFKNLDEKMLENKFFRKLHFEPLWADYQLIGDYKMSRQIVLNMPSTFYFSDKDISPKSAKNWETFLGSKGEIIQIGNDHFFINEYYREMGEHMIRKLKNGK